MFEHERLRVYDASQRLLAEVHRLKDTSAKGHGDLWKQTIEAAESIPLNIGEACGDGRSGKKANYFRIACGSAGECAAGIQSLITAKAITRREAYKALDLLHCITRMLSSLADRYDRWTEAQNPKPQQTQKPRLNDTHGKPPG